MLKRIIQAIKQFFTLTKSEQRGVIVLVILILITTTVYYALPYFFKSEFIDHSEFKQEIADFREAQQHLRDSIRIERLQNTGELDRNLANQKLKPFPFNPNKLPEEAWKALGLTDKQIKSIKNYEAKGGKFKRKEDLKKMYAISAIEYEILEPYIRVPSLFLTKTDKEIEKEYRGSGIYKAIEINRADSARLEASLKIPGWLAARIVKYRNLLGGFYQAEQLAEVYGLDSLAVVKRSKSILVDQSLIQKLDLNKSSFKQLVRHPYISYKLTKYIVDKREQAAFKSIEDIKESPLVTEPLFYKIRPYLVVSE